MVSIQFDLQKKIYSVDGNIFHDEGDINKLADLPRGKMAKVIKLDAEITKDNIKSLIDFLLNAEPCFL